MEPDATLEKNAALLQSLIEINQHLYLSLGVWSIDVKQCFVSLLGVPGLGPY